MKKLIFIIILSLFFLTKNEAQSWKRNPSSIFFGMGTNNFMGDLGGGKGNAAHFLGLRDLNLDKTRPTWQFGYRYRFHEYFTVKTGLTYALISGSDVSSNNYGRKARNLSFKSNIFELSGQIEYYFIKEKQSRKSSFGSLKGFTPFSAYILLGVGALYYNPKAKVPEISDKWVSLRPLGTEGQYANPDGTPYQYVSSYHNENGIYPTVETPKPYSKIAVAVSMGIGVKYEINKLWAVGFEISNRYTTTDYLDDTHDKYFNYAEHGLTPPDGYNILYADRHLTRNDEAKTVNSEFASPYLSGKTRRGEANYNDAYIIALVNVYYKIGGTKRGAKPKYR